MKELKQRPETSKDRQRDRERDRQIKTSGKTDNYDQTADQASNKIQRYKSETMPKIHLCRQIAIQSERGRDLVERKRELQLQ